MDKHTFKILDFLSNHIFGSIVDIRDIVNKIFIYRKGISEDEFETEKRLIIRFFEGMEKTQYVNFNGSRNIGAYHKDRDIWFEEGKLRVLITLDGLQAINQTKLNKSIIINNKRQVFILFGALLISLASVVISWYNYKVTLNANNPKQQYLLPSKELIEMLKEKPIKSTYQKPHPIIQIQQRSF